MADIFLSYASEDRDRVAPLVVVLEAEGFSVWWDRRIGIGSSFDREIERELSDAKCVVTVWSNSSVNSDWVRVESQEGMDRGILVPVCIDDVKPPLAFRRVQAADLRTGDTQAMSAFLRAVSLTSNVSPTLANPKPLLPTSQQKSGSPLLMPAILALTMIVAGFLWWSTQRQVSIPVVGKMVTPLRSVVVMPFENHGNSLSSATIDALHSDVINLMGRDGYLNMIGRSTARRLQTRGESLAVIAEETGASHVVEVALRAAGSNTKVSMNLIETDTKASVWSFSFDEPLEDSIDSHRRLAEKIAGRLWWQIKNWQRLTPQTVDERAFELAAIGFDMLVYGPEMIEVYEQALTIQ